MSTTLVKSLAALIPVSMLLFGAMVTFFKGKSLGSLLQLIGVCSLVIVILAHISEALHLFPSMRWGLEHSAGHYLDASSALLALIFFPTGYLLQALKNHSA